MTIHLRNDSDGVTHQIWAQRQVNSCAVASIWMARNIALQMSVDETEWELAWRMYHRVVAGMALVPPAPAPMSLHPDLNRTTENMTLAPGSQDTFQNMFANAGTFMNQVEQQLKNDGLTVVKTNFVRGTLSLQRARISDTSPAIVLLGWYTQVSPGNWNRNGGHFIVAARSANNGGIVFLDPWEGRLTEAGAGPRYAATNGWFEQAAYISK